MKIDMSPQAIENRLKLVGELAKACLLIRRNTLKKVIKEREINNVENCSPKSYKNKIINKGK